MMRLIRTATAAVTVAAISATPCWAAAKRLEQSLQRLDPATRFEQVCDLEAMARIRRDPNPHRPDRAVGSAVSEVRVEGNTMQGTGGAFRSKGKWYLFSFTCRTTPDHMKVEAFAYRLGIEIPEEKWEDYGLWR